MIYLGSYTTKQSVGIYQLNPQVQLAFEIDNPTYLSQTDNYLYSIFSGSEGVGVAIFDKTKHTLVQKVFSDEIKGACHIYVNEANNFLVTSNYHEASFHVYFRKEGVWQSPIKVESPDKSSRMHYAYFAPKSEVLYVTDLGLDLIYLYRLSDLSKPFETLTFAKGSGVRHFVMTKDETLMVVMAEYSGELFVLKNHKLISTIQTNPNHNFGEAGAAIRFNKEENLCAVSLRTNNELVVYEINGDHLIEIDRFDSGGQHPRDFNFIDDNTILCANRDTNNVVWFTYSKENKKYTKTKELEAFEIVCVSV